MANLIIRPASGAGNKVVVQDQAGAAVLTTADAGATMASTVTGIPAAGVTGVLPAAVTGGSGLTAVSATNITSGVLPSGVTGGTGLTPTMDFAWWDSPASLSTIYTTYNNYARQGTSITQSADRATIAVAGYYFADSMARVTAAMGTMEMYKNSSQTYTYSSSMGTHDHSGGQYSYSHAGFMGYLGVGDVISAKASAGYYSSSTGNGYNGAFYIWRLR